MCREKEGQGLWARVGEREKRSAVFHPTPPVLPGESRRGCVVCVCVCVCVCARFVCVALLICFESMSTRAHLSSVAVRAGAERPPKKKEQAAAFFQKYLHAPAQHPQRPGAGCQGHTPPSGGRHASNPPLAACRVDRSTCPASEARRGATTQKTLKIQMREKKERHFYRSACRACKHARARTKPHQGMHPWAKH